MADSFTFDNLWKNHPIIVDKGKACIGGGFDNGNTIGNQCAINISVAFEKCGVSVGEWGIQGCNLAKREAAHKNHAIRAQELASALKKNTVAGIGSLQKITPEDFNLSLAGKQGIIFFKDYWRRPTDGPSNRSGDHIDLWNGSKTTTAGWLRLNLLPSINLGPWQYSNLEGSKEIWFWAVA